MVEQADDPSQLEINPPAQVQELLGKNYSTQLWKKMVNALISMKKQGQPTK